MSQAAKILEMNVLGFSREHIARHLGLSNEQVGEVIRKNTRPAKTKRNHAAKACGLRRKPVDRPAMTANGQQSPTLFHEAPKPPPIIEVKPGFYVLTAEDLLAFASRLQEQQSIPPDPYLDYVQKDLFLEQFGISEKTLQRHQKDGLLKVYKLGNKQYLKKSQVVAALEKGKL